MTSAAISIDFPTPLVNGLRVYWDKSDTHHIHRLKEMDQFKALVCTGKVCLSLPLLAAYLDEHALPADIGNLKLPSLLAQKQIVKDPEGDDSG